VIPFLEAGVLNIRSVVRVNSLKRRVAASLLTVGAFTILVKAVGAVKVLIIARYFGVADAADAFLLAFVLIMFLAEAISGATTASLIPAVIELRERGEHTRARAVCSTITLITAAQLAALSLMLLVCGQSVLSFLASGFAPEKLQMAVSLLEFMLPVLLLAGMSATWRALLNATGQFAVPAITPVLAPLMTILIVYVHGSASTGGTLVIGTLTGSAIETALIAWNARRRGLPVFPNRCQMDGLARRVLRQYGHMLAGTGLLSGSTIVNYSMAAMLGAGSVAALTYGTKVLSVLLAIGPSAIATVALPHFSRMAARGEWSAIAEHNKTYQLISLFLTIPVTAALVYTSEPLVRLLYERGAFTHQDTRLVAEIQRLCVLQLPFAMLSALVFRLISSLKSNDVLMRGAAVHAVATVSLNFACIQWLGVAGIALASSIAAAIYYAYLALMLQRLLKASSDVSVAGASGCVPA
jgi:putative peptidoglycan lipid II flippase